MGLARIFCDFGCFVAGCSEVDRLIHCWFPSAYWRKTRSRRAFNVKVANATDTDFWNMMRLLEPIEEIVLRAVPNHHSNIHGATRIRASGFNCCVVAIAKHETEVEETLKMSSLSFNL